ncbi:MAG: hypothetical protein ACJ72E_05385 [Marmoricola sp.]
MTRTRHVWVLPALDVGEPAQGLVVSWRSKEHPIRRGAVGALVRRDLGV